MAHTFYYGRRTDGQTRDFFPSLQAYIQTSSGPPPSLISFRHPTHLFYACLFFFLFSLDCVVKDILVRSERERTTRGENGRESAPGASHQPHHQVRCALCGHALQPGFGEDHGHIGKRYAQFIAKMQPKTIGTSRTNYAGVDPTIIRTDAAI